MTTKSQYPMASPVCAIDSTHLFRRPPSRRTFHTGRDHILDWPGNMDICSRRPLGVFPLDPAFGTDIQNDDVDLSSQRSTREREDPDISGYGKAHMRADNSSPGCNSCCS